MSNQINVIITNDNYSNNHELLGHYRNGILVIHITTTIPEVICISVDHHSVNIVDIAKCLNLLRKKLCNCEMLINNATVMRYYSNAQSFCLFGKSEGDLANECIKEIHFHITYSLHKLNF
ncbi:hypothetical protein [Pedobacter alpinus]|uniref:Uncharacterized protein n=1 Tax=Pedobacter alpinus TaxID=1590643 RepID=A0ABW5TQK9_9SPHI